MVENSVIFKKDNGLVSKLTHMEKKVFHRCKSSAKLINENNFGKELYNHLSKLREEKYMANNPFPSASERDRVYTTLDHIAEKKIDTNISFYLNKDGRAESDF
ncbi:hypothetical protein KY313_01260 [Candidatus Woesearchaeota archaeon]|jgi:hypothetical protein|nr:hypothetical protein [Candidatus Woesearchaeota archaeon]